ncbi:Prophage antirepressor [Fructobacillus tropaeoli]|uniref:BRO family protein n=1 Tax=Fructobacillus tropaeoli TaxID=709323 RepID=UPI002D8EDD16|nr:Prophage antirepressor [Fructobacillus tropaeoli]
MANEVKAFNFESMNVRTVTQNDETWFVAVDLAKVLDIKNPSDALKRLEEDERARFNLGRQGEANIVSEAGLYNFIGASRKTEAKKFMRWVNHEVLPSIRKTGSYSVQPMDDFDKIALIAQGTTKLKEQVHGIETKVDTYIENQVITATDSNAIARAVSKRVHQYGALHRIDREERGPLFKDLNRQIKEVTGAGNRSRIKSKDYDMVIECIENWEPTTATKMLMDQDQNA